MKKRLFNTKHSLSSNHLSLNIDNEPYGYINEKINNIGEPIITVNNLSKIFHIGVIKKKTKIALDNVSFQIKENEHTAILGANGAGKTTLIEIMCGLNKPTSGNIIYNLGSQNFKNKIGIQFQSTNYPSNLTVADILKFIIKLYNIKIENFELNELMNIFGINKIYRKNLSSLSGGEAQRVNTMLSLIHNPKILFLDELSTGLDIKIRTRIKQFIKDYAFKHKITIVIVSHDIEEIDYISNHIIFLKEGKKIIDTSKEELINKYGSLINFFNKNLN
ncbi:ABC transporter ATP-binding protein [Mycoplasmoides alvi]|uniref:ABC transporter ATP-binding protein n=1 Tax=Mycoplasmoides alvi TaxID=78580 RepID=UPI00069837A6|nr:ABC transporter ATP-binding protein [Mycoplasmoides alvi]